MLPLETKQSGGKLLPHLHLWGDGGSVSRGSIVQHTKGDEIRYLDQEVGCGLDWAGPGQGQVAGAFECGNEPSGSIKCGEFLD